MLENFEQFVFLSQQSSQQLIDLGTASANRENPLKARAEGSDQSGRGPLLETFQCRVKAPDEITYVFHQSYLLWCCRHQLLQQPLRIHSAQGVITSPELAIIITENHGIA